MTTAYFRLGISLSAASLAAGMSLVTTYAHAACPLELAIYGDAESAAGIDFQPSVNSAVVTNTFRMALDKGVVLNGIVMWTDVVARQHALMM